MALSCQCEGQKSELLTPWQMSVICTNLRTLVHWKIGPLQFLDARVILWCTEPDKDRPKWSSGVPKWSGRVPKSSTTKNHYNPLQTTNNHYHLTTFDIWYFTLPWAIDLDYSFKHGITIKKWKWKMDYRSCLHLTFDIWHLSFDIWHLTSVEPIKQSYFHVYGMGYISDLY